MLEVISVSKYFGGLGALKDISLKINKGDFWGLIGPNGSGKTTLFNILSGVLMPSSGRLTLMGQDLTGLTPDKICRLGLSRTFQVPRPFKSLNVIENITTAILFGSSPTSSSREYVEEVKKEALKYLKFVNLEVAEETMPGELGLPGLRRLEIARALATRPKILLLDEVLSGLNQEELIEASSILKRIHDEMGMTIIWVEHIMSALMSIVKRVIVLNNGIVIAEGSPSEASNDKGVIEAYLGKE